MEFFLKRTKGSITVLVALIMMPTVFFTSFLVDLARLKLYGNQAVMVADNYGETALTYYDNVLKELYGLFAITQDQEALEALNGLDAYIKSSFNPAESTIIWENATAFSSVSYEGFMPYSAAEVELSYAPVVNANLGNPDVMATQIGDFMKFRIVQQYLDGENTMMDAISDVQKMQENAKAMTKKMEYDQAASKMFDKMRTYYEALKIFEKYPDYIKGVNNQYTLSKNVFTQLENSESYKTYKEYEKNAEEIKKAVEHKEKIEEYEKALKEAEEKKKKAEEEEKKKTEENKKEETNTETENTQKQEDKLPEKPADLTEREIQLLQLKEKYDNDPEARKDKLQAKLDVAIVALKGATTTGDITCSNYGSKLSNLKSASSKVTDAANNLEGKRNELQDVIRGGNVSKKITDGMSSDLEKIDDVTGYDSSTKSSDFKYIEYYEKTYTYIDTNDTPVNEQYKTQMDKMISTASDYKAALFDDSKTKPEWPESLKESDWKNFIDVKEYKDLYEELKNCFETPDTDAEERANNSKKLAEEKQKAAEEALSGDENTTARDVPACFGYEAIERDNKFSLLSGAQSITDAFSINGLKNAAQDLVLKFYVVSYDFGMFSSRVTNLEDDSPLEDIVDPDTDSITETKESKEVQASLTGYEMSRKLNYLYQAEIEYLLGGSDSSKENLNEVRNKICAFRGVMNFASTYSVSEVHNAITTISNSASTVNPILGLVVNGVLRASVAAIETAADWSELKKGEGVKLYKAQWDDLQCADVIEAVVGGKGEGGTVEKVTEIEMDYEQYLFIMLLFLTTKSDLDRRTANLIELNVNAAIKNVGEDGVLDGDIPFRMANAHTAVDSTCTVKLGFVVMPENFLKAVASEESYGRYKEWDAEGYQFTVTRGY